MSPKCDRTLIPGDVVIDCKPLVHILYEEYKSKHCDNCFKLSDQLKTCSKCRQMFYCDKRCQRIDWKYHKNECKLYSHQKYDPKMTSSRERLCLRLYLCIKSDETFATKKYQLFDDSEVSLNDIEVNVDDLRADMDRLVEFKLLTNHCKDYGFDYDRKELFRWFAFIATNPSIVVMHYFPELEPNFCHSDIIRAIGLGLYIQTSCLSHSCSPNSATVGNGLSLQLRAIKLIPIGEQITISYIKLSQNKTERQKQLKKLFGIDCKCEKCELNLDSNIDYSKFSALETNRNVGNISTIYRFGIDANFASREELITSFQSIYGAFHPIITLICVYSLMDLNDCPITTDKQFLLLCAQSVFDDIVVTHGVNHPICRIYAKIYSEIISR